MGVAAASDQADIIPANMDELVENYYDLIIGMVRKNGVPDQDAEDAVNYIVERLTVTDVIAQFDPDYVTVHQGKPVKTRFSTFLGKKVLLYCRGERGRINRRAWHELQILDRPADEEAAVLPALLGVACDDYSGVEDAESIAQMRARLAAVPPRSARDTCDLAALFDELVHEISETGAFSYAAIQARFSISGTTAGAWLARLRTVLRQATGRPAVTIGGVELTGDQVASALKILREARGIMVAQPLKKAGHPLSGADKDWYHAVAREEIKRFPKLATEPGTHRKPAGHVKEAVMHRFERILSEAGVPDAGVPELPVPLVPAPRRPADDEPEPEATARDLVEAELWRTRGIDPDDVDRILATVERVYAAAS